MQDQLRISVVGCGYWGKHLIRNFNDSGQLYSICDSNKDTLRTHTEQYPHIRAFSSYQEVCSSAEIDAVAIATPAVTHYDLVKLRNFWMSIHFYLHIQPLLIICLSHQV